MISLGMGGMDTDEVIAILEELKREEEQRACIAINLHILELRKFHLKRVNALNTAMRRLKKKEINR